MPRDAVLVGVGCARRRILSVPVCWESRDQQDYVGANSLGAIAGQYVQPKGESKLALPEQAQPEH